MQFLQNVSLKSKTTLQMRSNAAWYGEARSAEDVLEAVMFARERQLPILVLGGGSNLVLSSDIDGLVLANRISGCELTNEKVRLGAGENWHEFVSQATRQGIGGFENLALIPGNVGAAPMQNIGAYGLELADRFISLNAINLDSGESVTFDRSDCRFGYRESLFKQERLWCIISMELEPSDELRASYPGVHSWLQDHELEATHESIYKAVCEIRTSKLPDVLSHPNAGSFFKNPVVAVSVSEALQQSYPSLPSFPDSTGVKLSAAWLIEQAGLKGTAEGGFLVSEQHALVITHDGTSHFAELHRLIDRIRSRVLERFGVELEVEPTIYPG
ncbi:MAG: UDP-N-acetylmuramate dehydrogenase [Pseudomonadales bacterium]|nr:UDP-N-acetylmuramate dehydrogenase [Pseudomonadales bacterium]